MACKRVLCYLKGSVGQGLLFFPVPYDLPLVVYCDADHAGCKVTRKSTSGVCVFLGNNLVVWSSRKQTVVVWSVGEATYRAIDQGVIEIMWLVSLFFELGLKS